MTRGPLIWDFLKLYLFIYLYNFIFIILANDISQAVTRQNKTKLDMFIILLLFIA